MDSAHVRRTVPIIALGLVLVVVLVGAAVGILLRAPHAQQDRFTAVEKVAGNWPGSSAGDPGQWSGAEEGEVLSLELAQRKAGFHVPQPSYLPEGAGFVQVHFSQAGPSRRKARIELRYTTGLWIVIQRRDLEPDMWGLAEHLNSPEAGEQLGDNPTPWLKVEVNGIRAMAHESNTETISGVTRRTIPASVSWWKDGIEYEVFDVSGRRVAELLKVAESLK